MITTGCDFQPGKPPKRFRAQQVTPPTDRLTNLPDDTIHRILSFLDTKSAVQTSVLSHAWRYIWRQVNILDLRRSRFPTVSSFAQFVRKTLSLRSDLDLCKVSLVDDVGPLHNRTIQNVLGLVVDYATAHNCRHLVIHLELNYCYGSLYTLDSVSSSSLETLAMRNVVICDGFRTFDLPVLTDLTLRNCPMLADEKGVVDLVSKFPSLTGLKVYNCTSHSLSGRECSMNVNCIKIHGPKLVSLGLAAMPGYEVELVTPKLRYLFLQVVEDGNSSPDFSKVRLSRIGSLGRADILVVNPQNVSPSKEKDVDYGWNCLFRGLLGANLVVFSCYGNRVVDNLCDFLNHDRPRFEKLRGLFIYSDDEPDKVIRYKP